MSNNEKTPLADSHDPYRLFERQDEDAIRAEMQGIYVETLVYQFEDSRGKMVTGLSIKGVYELAKSMVRRGYDILCDEAHILEDTADEYRASCKATFTAPNGKTLSTYGYSKATKTYGRNVNEFAYVQALSKAQRNALRTIIPEKQATEFIKAYLDEKRGGRVQYFTPRDADPARAETAPAETADHPPPPRKTGKTAPPPRTQSALTVVRLLKPLVPFTGVDGRFYGPYNAEDIGNIPTADGDRLIKEGYACAIDDTCSADTSDTQQQWPLSSGGQTYGTLEVHGSTYHVAFTDPIDIEANSGPVTNFLEKRFLDGLGRSLEQDGIPFSYQMEIEQNRLQGLTLTGSLTEQRIRELVKTCTWVARVASEKQLQGGTSL